MPYNIQGQWLTWHRSAWTEVSWFVFICILSIACFKTTTPLNGCQRKKKKNYVFSCGFPETSKHSANSRGLYSTLKCIKIFRSRWKKENILLLEAETQWSTSNRMTHSYQSRLKYAYFTIADEGIQHYKKVSATHMLNCLYIAYCPLIHHMHIQIFDKDTSQKKEQNSKTSQN